MNAQDWTSIPVGLSASLSVALVCRLIKLRLYNVYGVFCAFLVFEVASTTLAFLVRFSSLYNYLDYRVFWIGLRVGPWFLSIWMVYALLNAILANYPGILLTSRRVLNGVVPLSLVLAILTARPEYLAFGTSSSNSLIERTVVVAIVLERVISTIALLVLLLMLLFILWFPVQMPRNLAIFSVGFVIYFSAKTSLLLIRTFLPHQGMDFLTNGVNIILCACLLCWLFFLNRSGELAPVTLGHSWHRNQQEKLISDLESINTALARAGRR